MGKGESNNKRSKSGNREILDNEEKARSNFLRVASVTNCSALCQFAVDPAWYPLPSPARQILFLEVSAAASLSCRCSLLYQARGGRGGGGL